MWARVQIGGRTIRLTPNMTDLMLSLLERPGYPADGDNRRTYRALQRLGLITPVGYESWALTQQGWKTAINIKERTQS